MNFRPNYSEDWAPAVVVTLVVFVALTIVVALVEEVDDRDRVCVVKGDVCNICNRIYGD